MRRKVKKPEIILPAVYLEGEGKEWLSRRLKVFSTYYGKQLEAEHCVEKRRLLLEWDKKESLGLFNGDEYDISEMSLAYSNKKRTSEPPSNEEIKDLFD